MFSQFTDREQQILRLAVQGKTREEIARGTKFELATVRNTLSDLYKRTGLKNLHHATAYYGYLLGLRGEQLHRIWEFDQEFISENIFVPKGMEFEIGDIRHPATLVSSEIQWPADLRCVVEDVLYEPPSEVTGQINDLRAKTEKSLREKGQIVYEVPDDLIAVTRLEPETEFYEHIRLTLRKTGYLTSRAIHENLELRGKYIPDPFNLRQADLPLPLAVSLLVVAGKPPRLIIGQRSSGLGTYAGFYTAAVDALGQARRDTIRVGGETVFDIRSAMLSELEEERDIRSPLGDRLKMLALVFDYRVLTFIVVGCLEIPEFNPETIKRALSRAKEGTYEILPFPVVGSQSELDDLNNLCEHLRRNLWTPCASIGLVVWLKRLFGVQEVYHRLGQNVFEGGAEG